MITLRVWFVLIVVATMLAGGRVWTAFIGPSTTITDSTGRLLQTGTMPRLDRFGNEIEDAVGDYRIDRLGEVYERHSPDTEVARLAPPTI